MNGVGNSINLQISMFSFFFRFFFVFFSFSIFGFFPFFFFFVFLVLVVFVFVFVRVFFSWCNFVFVLGWAGVSDTFGISVRDPLHFTWSPTTECTVEHMVCRSRKMDFNARIYWGRWEVPGTNTREGARWSSHS